MEVPAPGPSRRGAHRQISKLISYLLTSILRQHFRDLDAAPLARRDDARADHRKRSSRALAAHLGRAVPAHRAGELLELLDEGVVLRASNRARAVAPALEHAQTLMHIVICARFLAVDIHQVVLGSGGVARVERREGAVLVLEDQARDVRIVAWEYELREPPAHRSHRT